MVTNNKGTDRVSKVGGGGQTTSLLICVIASESAFTNCIYKAAMLGEGQKMFKFFLMF